MPKDEFDFQDPFELNGMALFTAEDSTGPMAECFIEEFLRIGYSHKQILGVFRNPHYLGPNLAYQKRGELFIQDLITEIFARWGKTVAWPPLDREVSAPVNAPAAIEANPSAAGRPDGARDPMGAPIPDFIP